MPSLIEPFPLGSLHLRNRIVMPPMGLGLSNEKGEVTEKITTHYLDRCIDVGLLIVESTSVTIDRAPRTKLGNPRLELIHFHTLRHWKATDLYHRTKDLLYVQQFLGHKSISNTLKYIQLSNAMFDEDTDHYICKVAKTVQDATELVELGFDYVTDIDGVKLFRKPA